MIGIVLLLVPILYAAICYLALPDMCGNEELARYPSPDGTKELVVFERDCGAVTDFSTHGSLLAKGHTLRNRSGNVFAADGDHGAAPVSPQGGLEVHVRWLDAQHLMLQVYEKARIFYVEHHVMDTDIQFQTFR